MSNDSSKPQRQEILAALKPALQETDLIVSALVGTTADTYQIIDRSRPLYSLAKSLALEFASYGIRINAIGPGPIDTPLLRAGRTPEEYENVRGSFESRLPIKRLGRPEEAAAVVDFLLSERAGFITGQLIQPNGGQVMW